MSGQDLASHGCHLFERGLHVIAHNMLKIVNLGTQSSHCRRGCLFELSTPPDVKDAQSTSLHWYPRVENLLLDIFRNTMGRLQWVDGLRGLAAFSVCFNHIIYGEIKAPYRSFWDNPPEENRKLVQLAPFRLLFASKAMVPLFMILGGYTISHGLIHIRETSDMAALCRRVQSMAVRRFIRLYLPVLVLAVVAQALYYFDLFSWDYEGMGILRGRKPFQNPISHMTYAMGFVFDLTDIVEFQFTQGFFNQTWTIPYEFRGSLVVSLLTIISSPWKKNLRLLILVAISAHLLWYNHWDVFCFVAGQALAESQAAYNVPKPASRRNGHLTCCWQLVFLMAGLYLFCLQSETELPPEYRLLAHLQLSPHWTRHHVWIDVQYNWHSIGALLVVSAVSSSATYQRQLERRVPQYLGRLSFSLYIVHEVVFRMWRNPLRDFFWVLWHRGGGGYPGTETAYVDAVPFLTAWIGGGATLGLVTILTAEAYHRFVDQRILGLARSFDRWVTLENREGIERKGKME